MIMTSSSWVRVRRVWWPLRRAAECGARALLLEKNRRPGVKILMSGGTRCNITNASGLRRLDVVSGPIDPAYDPAAVTRHPGHPAGVRRQRAFLGPACAASTSSERSRMFEEAGVATKVEANGKIFPVSDKAAHVLDALVQRLERSGASFAARPRCLRSIESKSSRSRLDSRCDSRTRSSGAACDRRRRRLFVPRVRDDRRRLRDRAQFGHTIVDPRPALVPLRVAADWVAGCKGLSVPDAVASVDCRDDGARSAVARRCCSRISG